MLLAQAVATASPSTPQRFVPMAPRPKAGIVECDLRDNSATTFRLIGTMSEVPASDKQPAGLGMSIKGVGNPILDGEYRGWFIASNSSFSFSSVNQQRKMLVTLTFFGVDFSSQQVAVVAKINPINQGEQSLFVGFCQARWDRSKWN
jgi:hypothetical protein